MRLMKSTPVASKNASAIKTFIGQNVLNRIKVQYPDKDYPKLDHKAKALAKRCGIGKNTILRLIDHGDPTSISIDKLAKLAEGLDLLPYQLLIPYLDPKNPAIALPPSVAEKAWYGKIPPVDPSK